MESSVLLSLKTMANSLQTLFPECMAVEMSVSR